jgi:hypothetical protein
VQGYAGIAHSFMFTKKIGMAGAEKDKVDGQNLALKDLKPKGKKEKNLKKKKPVTDNDQNDDMNDKKGVMKVLKRTKK